MPARSQSRKKKAPTKLRAGGADTQEDINAAIVASKQLREKPHLNKEGKEKLRRMSRGTAITESCSQVRSSNEGYHRLHAVEPETMASISEKAKERNGGRNTAKN